MAFGWYPRIYNEWLGPCLSRAWYTRVLSCPRVRQQTESERRWTYAAKKKKKERKNGRKSVPGRLGENSLSFLRSKKPSRDGLKGFACLRVPLLSFWPSVFLSVGWLIRVEGGETKRERERERERKIFGNTRVRARKLESMRLSWHPARN